MQVPHLVFIRRTTTLSTSTPMIGCHFASRAGTAAFSSRRYQRSKVAAASVGVGALGGHYPERLALGLNAVVAAGAGDIELVALTPHVVGFPREHLAG